MRWIVVLASAVSLLAASCGGGASTSAEPLTVGGYVEWCADQASDEDDIEALVDTDTTWGETREMFESIIEMHESVTPPLALRAYHSDRVVVLEHFHDLASEQDGDDILTTTSILSAAGGLGELIALGAMVDSAGEELPPDLRGRLVAAGCINEEDS